MYYSMKVPTNGQSLNARNFLTILLILFIQSNLHAQFAEQTNETDIEDVWNDVATDPQGNIYVVGTFINSTEIDGELITSVIEEDREQFMVAKYDTDGNLEWKTNGITPCLNKGSSTGNVIAINESTNSVYISGSHHGMVVMQDNGTQIIVDNLDPCNLIDSGEENYIMELTMDEGDYEDFYSGLRGSVSAMVVANNGAYINQIYVAINGPIESWIYRINTSPLGISGNNNNISTFSDYPHTINDIFYRDESVYCIGTTEGSIKFGSLSVNFNSNSQTSTAWAAKIFNNSATIDVIAMNYGGIGGSSTRVMTGDQIILDNENNVIIAGLYSEHLINPFELGSVHNSSNSIPTYRDAYIMRLNSVSLKANDALQSIETGYNEYEISKIAMAGLENNIFISTTYTGKTLNFLPTSGTNIDLFLSGFNPFVYYGEKIAVMHYSSSPSLSKTWHNTTRGLNSNSDKHFTKAMAVHNDLVYTCGNFTKRMDFSYLTTFNNEIGAYLNFHSAFLIRNDHIWNVPGSFKLYTGKDKNKFSNIDVSVYPNPNGGSFYINGVTKEDKIEIFDILGKTLSFTLSFSKDKAYIEIENEVDIAILKVNNIGYQVMIHD